MISKEKIAYLLKQILIGMDVEREHTKDEATALKITLDHLKEHLNYYETLKKVNLSIEKALPPGTVRQRKDGKYQKAESGEWTKVRDQGEKKQETPAPDDTADSEMHDAGYEYATHGAAGGYIPDFKTPGEKKAFETGMKKKEKEREATPAEAKPGGNFDPEKMKLSLPQHWDFKKMESFTRNTNDDRLEQFKNAFKKKQDTLGSFDPPGYKESLDHNIRYLEAEQERRAKQKEVEKPVAVQHEPIKDPSGNEYFMYKKIRSASPSYRPTPGKTDFIYSVKIKDKDGNIKPAPLSAGTESAAREQIDLYFKGKPEKKAAPADDVKQRELF
jgi:hypothetical protein